MTPYFSVALVSIMVNKNISSKQDYLKNQDFWNEVNAGCDKYSIPKQIGIDLIKMHQERGDQIYLLQVVQQGTWMA